MTTERQMKILQYLAGHDQLEIAQLSEFLQVSPSTIRRELRVMEKSGLLVLFIMLLRDKVPENKL